MRRVNGCPSQAAIGRALGLARSTVTKCKRLGMPVTSTEAAMEWRAANIRLRVTATPPNTSMRRARALAGFVAAQLAEGRAPDLEPLRAAMRGVPADQRPALEMETAVWDALLADLWAGLGPDPDPTPAVLSDAEAEVIRAALYAIASCEH